MKGHRVAIPKGGALRRSDPQMVGLGYPVPKALRDSHLSWAPRTLPKKGKRPPTLERTKEPEGVRTANKPERVGGR